MAKQHTTEFKNDAVQYYLDNKDHLNYRQAAEKLGVGASTLQKWTKKFKEEGSVEGRGSSNYASDKDKEIARLKRELRDAEGAIEVLKQAINILGNRGY